MDEKILKMKAAISLTLYAITEILGWKGIVMLVWVAAMVLDYLSGSMAAAKRGEWTSKSAREGLWHKGGMILVVLECATLDLVMAVLCSHMDIGFQWPGIVLPLVLIWYIITEFGSVLENAAKMGAPVPKWLTKLLKASVQAVEKTGAAIGDGSKNETEESK